MATVVSLLLLAMVFALATGFTICEFCFALSVFISWLIGGIAIGFVCPQLEKMHSGKSSPLTCSGGRTGIWLSYHCHIEAFGALCPCLPVSSRHPTLSISRVEPLATTCIATTVSVFVIAWFTTIALPADSMAHQSVPMSR